MSISRCIITGCCLYDRPQNRWIWGDLHQMGAHTFIFNASGNRWSYEPYKKDYRTVLVYDYYEKNSVIVFTRDAAGFNTAAIEYLQESEKNAN